MMSSQNHKINIWIIDKAAVLQGTIVFGNCDPYLALKFVKTFAYFYFHFSAVEQLPLPFLLTFIGGQTKNIFFAAE
mgnify:CR=1 FL=1